MKTREEIANWANYMLMAHPHMNVEDKNFFIAIKEYMGASAEWIKLAGSDPAIYECSKCHGQQDKKFIFCPECGRWMAATLGMKENER